MNQGAREQPTIKRMRLRYAGVCRLCNEQQPAGTVALYERATKTIRCTTCPAASVAAAGPAANVDEAEDRAIPLPMSGPLEPDEIDPGRAGASARREYERRRDGRAARTREKHPHLGGLILALSSDPQSTTAWATGAVGEERVGARLDALASSSVRVLHDRRIPKSRANIDHIVVCPSGVFVIDPKRYQGRPRLRVEGGILRPRVETLIVGRRNCSKLVDGVLKQVDLVRSTLEKEPVLTEAPVRGMLCFVRADWPLIGGSFSTRGIEVLWPKKVAPLIQQPGLLTDTEVESIHRFLATSFPPA